MRVPVKMDYIGRPLSDGGWNLLLGSASLLSLAAAFIHVLATADHFEAWWGYGIFFLALAVVQCLYSIALLNWARTPVFLAGIVGSLGTIGLYFIARVVELPFLSEHSNSEGGDILGPLSKAIEFALIGVLAGLLLDQSRAKTGALKNAEREGWLSPLKHPAVKIILSTFLVVTFLVIGYRYGTGMALDGGASTITASDAEECARVGCEVRLTATMATKRYAEKLGLWDSIEPRMKTSRAFVLNATAHVGTVRSLSLKDNVILKADGVTYPTVLQSLQTSSHHNSYLLFVPSYDNQGNPLFERENGNFHIVVKNTGGSLPQHTLTFQYSGRVGESRTQGPAQFLMIVGAAMAALMLTCTPCLLGSMAVGSITTGTTGGFAGAPMRTRTVKSTLIYLAALAVAYLAVAMVVYFLRLGPDDLRPLELAGGLALVAVGIALLRGTSIGVWLEVAISRSLARITSRSGLAESATERNMGLNGGSSSAMGASLAMVCSVAGAPTLSTATLLPLLVYAGLSSPWWAFLIIIVFLAICALPFVLFSVGLGEALAGVSDRFRNALLIGNALLLITFGLVLVVSPSTLADAVSAPVRIMLLPLTWLL